MSARFQLLSNKLLSKSLSESSIEELKDIVDQYPYFSPAQFMLAKKLKSVNAEVYTKQVQKTALFFHNPAEINSIINAEDFDTTFDWEKGNLKNFQQEVEIVTDTTEQQDVVLERDDYTTNTEIIETALASDEDALEQKEEETPITPAEDSETALPELEDETTFEPITAEDAESTEVEEENTEDVTDSTTSADLDKSEEDEEVENEEREAHVHAALSDQLKGLQKVLQTEPTAESLDKDLITFEPYHTVDYFASLGIKLSKEQGTDKMGKQLKSFTQWLKTMKRLPEADHLQNLDPDSEEKVNNMAAHSVETANILTETMAEVWVKQGNTQKAIEVYNKLSLLYPYKKAYFATKVENLKKAL